LWPFINEQDNFLLPQSIACLAAVLRKEDIEVSVIDCLPEKIGWKSLEAKIRELQPDVVGAGENHSIYASEAIKLVNMVKEISPGIITVLGGAHFTNAGELYLPNHPIDFIVRGEGEITLAELVRALMTGGIAEAEKVSGLSYFREGKVVYTQPRPLVENLDDLPVPAYDLMPMEKYGRARYLFSPGGATIAHSRGCKANCSFCVWWTQMAERSRQNGQGERLLPRWRTKSVERTLEEIEILYKKYNKRCLVFVDPSFNTDPDWNDEFASALMKKNWDVSWFAFMRGDCILRDEKNGIFEKLVRSGLVHVSIGVERAEDSQLRSWNKKFATTSQSYEVFQLLKKKYPQVFRQGTFILGVKSETPESMQHQLEFARLIDADYPAFHAVTPFPGTTLWKEARTKGWLEITDFDYYDLSTPVMRSDTMTREEIDKGIIELSKRYVNWRWLLKGLCSRHGYRRNMYLWFMLVTTRVFFASARHFLNPFRAEQYTHLVKPDWYDR